MQIIDNRNPADHIKVSVILLTYNHEPYVREALDSILCQQTDFKYEIIVHDDASTDGTQDIIREYAEKYPDIIMAVLQTENQYQKGQMNSFALYGYARGEYIGLLEGDDHWLCKDRLSMQVDFLDKHPDYSATAGVTQYYNDEGERAYPQMPAKKYTGKDASESDFVSISDAGIATSTVLGRAKFFLCSELKAAKKESPHVGDILIMIWLFEKGKIFVFDEDFQYHRIQTRQNASNYNSLFSFKEKVMDAVKVYEAIVHNFSKNHDMIPWVGKHYYAYWLYCIRHKTMKEYRELSSRLSLKERLRIEMLYLPRVCVGAVRRVERFVKRK